MAGPRRVGMALPFLSVVALIFGVSLVFYPQWSTWLSGAESTTIPSLAPSSQSPQVQDTIPPFKPVRFVLQCHDGVLIDTKIDDEYVQPTKNAEGRWQLVPRKTDEPAIAYTPEGSTTTLTDRDLPGVPSGTVALLGHSKSGKPMVFSPLMQLPTDPEELTRKGCEAVLHGMEGQQVWYKITEMRIPPRGEPHGDLDENLPDRLLVYSCEVLPGQKVTHNRVLVGVLSSAVSAHR